MPDTDLPPLYHPEPVRALLRVGDHVLRGPDGYRLVRADRVVSLAVAERMIEVGELELCGDQLPGLPHELAQTWRWRDFFAEEDL